MLKIGFIHDRPLFQQLLASPKIGPYPGLEDLICQSIANKKRIVEQDEFENGLRMSLNFGHTLGHAIESLCHHDFYHHGEAIAIGMVVDAKLAVLKDTYLKKTWIVSFKPLNVTSYQPVSEK